MLPHRRSRRRYGHRVLPEAAGDTDLSALLLGASPEDTRLLIDAYATAERAHAGQPRRDGTPYIGHPVEVALLLRDRLGIREPAILAAALLHDAVEDSDLTIDDLERFPERTRELVSLLTDPSPAMTGARRRAHYREIWKDSDATLLKAADRLSNLGDVVRHGDPELRDRYLRKTRREILGAGLPLAAHPVAGPLLRDALDRAAAG